MTEDIGVYSGNIKALDAIGGIGESIAKKITEYLRSGKIKTFEQLKKKVPYGLLELMDITGFGPATLRVLHDQLHINNTGDLVTALETGSISGIKGLGEKKLGNMRLALKLYKQNKRMPLQEAEKKGNAILALITAIPGVQKATLAGSLRRKNETVGDIDIVVQAAQQDRKKIVSRFITLPQVEKVLAKGSTGLVWY